ncbi:lipopolysaccharide biosynthesis protein [Rhodococcus sp. MEB064]|uniref:lipopolysaccharide biosynthesis protein n=1 Tax=Rhodococcus sp. MEB064 TaxID=1587522 RepID=UPI0005ACB3E8|nr:lipopolysaccharide biosynthesis protein [Rhodococcus sp. MEB064]KIQ17603.1 hypothetical protein RU01_10725 [Rhodococcus sp. MEB064]
MTEPTNISETSLGRTAARGAALSFGGQVSKIVVQLLGLIVLSRLLGPEQYGLIAMVTAIIGVGELLRDFGLSSAALQAKVLTHRQQSNLFWINTGIGLALGAVVAACSGVISAFYDRPELRVIALSLSVTFLMSGFSTQFRVRLNRNLRFGSLALIDVAAQLMGIGVAVVGALAGWEYHALIAQVIVQSATVAVAGPVVSRWWPGLPRRGHDMGHLLRFGGNVVATQLVAYVSRNVDSVLIGARFGSVSLGLYDRAFQIFTSPLNQIQAPATSVALPILRRLDEDDDRYSAFLLRGQAILMHVLLAAFALAWANATWLMNTVFGAQWVPAVPYLQVLLIAGAAQVASYATYWVFLSKGLPGSNLRFTLVSRAFTVAFIVAGSLVSPIAVAWGFALGSIVSWPLGLWWISRVTSAPTGAMFWSGFRAVVTYSICAATAYLMPLEDLIDAGALVAVCRAGVFAVCLAVVCGLSARVRSDIRSVISTVHLVRAKRAGTVG